MAQAIAINLMQSAKGGSSCRFDSAGLSPERMVSGNALYAVMRLGMNEAVIENRKCSGLPEKLNERKWDLILVMKESMKNEVRRQAGPSVKVLTLREFGGESGDIQDPLCQGQEVYDSVAMEIKRLLEKGFRTV
jgi:protein-tyrosine-phosphatase